MRSPAAVKTRLFRRESGLQLECFDEVEARFLERDVARYFDRGPPLAPGGMVLDVGANIGLFSAAVADRLGAAARVLAFEPAPPIFEVLSRNLSRLPGALEALPLGLGASEAHVELTYFPGMSCLSSTERRPDDLGAELRRVAASLVALIRAGEVMPRFASLPQPLLEGLVEGYVHVRLRPRRYTVPIRPLSRLIGERALERISLLKVDVEGAEEQVLEGVAPEHWPRIEAVALELERFAARVARVSERLSQLGFTVEAIQDQAQARGDFGLLYAWR
jgi:FkbM family methyltransferase